MRRNFLAICFMALTLFPATKSRAADHAALTLEALEQIALKDNPTLVQAAAAIREAAGQKLQAGLYPNPVVGYDGDEIRPGPITRSGEHGFFVQQNIVTAGKLRHRREVEGQKQAQAEAQAEIQRGRVLTSVRILYYQALGAQRLLEVRKHLAEVAEKAVTTSKQLYNVGQADEPDVLEAQTEAQMAQLAVLDAENNQQSVWRQLAAVVGDVNLQISPLAGSLDPSTAEIKRDEALAMILRESPEMKFARVGVARAEAALERARVEPVPDINVRGGLRYNRELLEGVTGRPFGLEGFAEIGVQLPIFNRNQGNVQAERAVLDAAQQEVDRVRLSLQERFAPVFQTYSNSWDAAQKYHQEIIPTAQLAYHLYLAKYREMAAAFPQVLIAQRTYFQLQESYVAVLVRLWRADSEIRGMLLTGGLEALGSSVGPSGFAAGAEGFPAMTPGTPSQQ